MDKNIQFEDQRRLKDFWALLLYIVALGAINTPFLLSHKSISFSSEGSFTFSSILLLVLKNLLLLSLGIAASMTMLIYIPRILIYSALFILPFFYIFIFFMFPAGGVFGIISLIFTVIAFVFYFFIIYKNINFIVAVVSGATRILSNYIGSFFAIFTALTIFSVAEGFIIITAESGPIIKALHYVSLLLLFWTLAATSYFYQVFVSAVVFAHIKPTGQNTSVSARAFRISLFALGSICFGALILALVQTIRVALSDLQTRNRRREDGGSIFTAILLVIFRIIISLLESIIENSNRLAFPYLAIHGTSYKESVIESYSLIADSRARGIAAYVAVDVVLSLLGLCFLLISAICNYFLFVDANSKLFGHLVVFGSLLSSIVFIGLLDMISAGSLALVYMNITSSKALDAYDIELSNAINEKKDYLSTISD